MTPSSQTVICAGFREDIDSAAIIQFVRGTLDSSSISELEDRNPISVNKGKLYINFKNPNTAHQTVDALSKISAKEICPSQKRLEIWVKDQGRSGAKFSVLDTSNAANADCKKPETNLIAAPDDPFSKLGAEDAE